MTKALPVYFNHDGGVDDLVSLFLLLQMEQVDLIGVSVIDADCYVEPAVSASRKIIDRYGRAELKGLEVARSNSRGKNPFPKDWRMHAFYVDALPLLNERSDVVTKEAAKPAHLDLIEKVSKCPEKATLLFTGPLTDLARALDADPSIEAKIEKLYWMGGTFLPDGNVHEPEHDGTAEWNAFWDPEAAKRVWDSGIKIEMVALESTNKVPLTVDTRKEWAQLRRFEGIDFLGQCYATVPPLVHFATNSTYYLWDVLTTAIIGKPELVSSHEVACDVLADGPSQGRTIPSEGGRIVTVVDDVDPEAFFRYLTDLARGADRDGVYRIV
ncbi:nucleoside hydrolase [Paenibacillus pasadenensis]|uniref:Inosine-uridine preferring nucleoside hydrolase n=1 Tax=Paenibacillus pasadenensis TaxID=217090 RepID=A0A2N5N1G7_9BACL|nr:MULTISPECIES: nucleoside hydrolase [Paenibacillus]PLT44180.1 Inosine-uridine preferring nucleoside hydrolase [Paenibacillus pasadenensis]QGG54710.1 ABC transporter substrate-binding protein [Paenibacillus sp. B01]